MQIIKYEIVTYLSEKKIFNYSLLLSMCNDQIFSEVSHLKSLKSCVLQINEVYITDNTSVSNVFGTEQSNLIVIYWVDNIKIWTKEMDRRVIMDTLFNQKLPWMNWVLHYVI